MPLNIDLNVPPYFDDYDETKNYHRILFRPSVAVQARELTQAQTILQNQIERFGNWAFKSGDIVQGCTVSDIPILPYAFLADAASNGTANSIAIDTREWINCVARSVTSNLEAKIVFANVGFQGNYPNSNIIYLKYLNTGNGSLTYIQTGGVSSTGEKVFSNSEMLQIINVTAAGNTRLANVYTMANTGSIVPIGSGHGITVSEGIVFINGVFVKVESPTIGIVNPTSNNAGNSVVGFVLNEQIVDENEDPTLYDNALGYSNENAPGARRLKLIPELKAYTNAAMAAANSKSFNAVAQYNFGSIVVKKDDKDLHSTVGEAIARRTYEESGNYVINPFMVDAISSDSGIVATINANTVLGRITQGLGYAQGQRVSLDKTMYIDMRRGVNTETRNDQIVTFSYGNYYLLNEVAGSFDFDTAQRVILYNTKQNAVTSRTFLPASPSGTNIGNAAVRMFTLQNGTPGSNAATYFLHVYDIKLADGYKPDDVKSVYYSGGNKGIGDLAKPGLQLGANKSQLFTFNSDLAVKNYKDQNLNNNTKYVYRKKLTGKTMSSSGVISVADAISAGGGSHSGGTDTMVYGGRVPAIAASGSFTIIAAANAESNELTGKISYTNTSTTVTAIEGGSFNMFNVGDLIKSVDDLSQVRTVTQIIDSTHLIIDQPWPNSNTGTPFKFKIVKGKHIPLAGSAYVNADSSSAFTIYTYTSLSASTTVDVIFDVQRTHVEPAKKEIRKSRFVKIDTRANPKGPWCLGFSDVHKINKIYANSSAFPTNATTGIDVTNRFVFDTGQKDTHYDLGYIYNTSLDIVQYPYLLVELDYFVANTTSGIGFFTINSYPIDDANTANTNAIQTKDLPLYIDENGVRRTLKSYIDFRVPSVPTAVDTGSCNTACTTQVTAAVALATATPSSTLTFNTSSGLNSPAYAKNLTADVTYYLPRKDMVYITSENVVKVKEGLSNLIPESPLSPDTAMPIAIIDVPAYPSLSSDQLDTLLQINKSSKTLVRDSSSSITCKPIVNRGYTMKDISKLDQRITNLEYYTQLNMLEKKAADMQVTDANGLNRYKNGIFVDNFSSYVNQLPSDPDYRLAIDPDIGVGRPYISRKYFKVVYNPSNTGENTNVQQTGRYITLPYTSVPHITQSSANKYRSAALVAAQWNGSLTLFPPADNAINLNDTGSLSMVIDNTKPWKDFAASPFGSKYGEWRTTSSSETTSVRTGGSRISVTKTIGIDLGFMGGSGGDNIENYGYSRDSLYNLLVSNGENPPADFIIGNVSGHYNGGYNPNDGAWGASTWYHTQAALDHPGPWGPGSYEEGKRPWS